MLLGQRALAAIAEGDEAGALAEINAADLGEARWCAAMFLSCLKQTAAAVVGPSASRQRKFLRSATRAVGSDIEFTKAQLVIHDALRSASNG